MNRQEKIDLLISWEESKCPGFHGIYEFYDIEEKIIPLFIDEYFENYHQENKMLKPVGKRVLIQPIEAKQGSIIVTNQKPSQFKVIDIGEEVSRVMAGDIIFLEKHYGVEIDYEGVKFLVIDEASILAKLD